MKERDYISHFYVKKNKLEKINNSKYNNRNIFKKSLSQRKIDLRRIKLYKILNKDASLNNISSGQLINSNSSHRKSEMQNDINNNLKEIKNYKNKYSKITIPKRHSIENSKTYKDDKNLIINKFIQDFLHQKNLITYRNKNFPYKYIQPFKTNDITNNGLFYLKKYIIFERVIRDPTLYGNFQNYKQETSTTDNKNTSQELNKNISNYININTNINNTAFRKIRKIYNLKKVLMEDDKRNTNGNFPYRDHDEEKKDTLLKGLNPDNSIRIVKKRLTKNYSLNKDNIKAYINKQDNIREDNEYLKKIIINNRLKNTNQLNLKNESFNQKNRKILNIINKNFQYKNQNKSQEENLKIVNRKNEEYLKKRRMKEFSNHIRVISHHLNSLNKRVNDILYNAKDGFNGNIDNLFC